MNVLPNDETSHWNIPNAKGKSACLPACHTFALSPFEAAAISFRDFALKAWNARALWREHARSRSVPRRADLSDRGQEKPARPMRSGRGAQTNESSPFPP